MSNVIDLAARRPTPPPPPAPAMPPRSSTLLLLLLLVEVLDSRDARRRPSRQHGPLFASVRSLLETEAAAMAEDGAFIEARNLADRMIARERSGG